MANFDAAIDSFKKIVAWVATKSPQPADPRICPLCFDPITAETRFIRYCPICKKSEVVNGLATRELFARCKRLGCKANRTLAQRPFLAHENCKRLNPLVLNLNEGAKNRVESLGETFALRWLDVSGSGGKAQYRDVKHWTLPVIHDAAENVAGVKAMWFPSELLRLVSSGKGKRVQLRGPTDVGKSVLSSIAVNPDSLPADLQVENFVYASPYIATEPNAPEEQRKPFRFFANALQAIQSLRDWQPLDMHATRPAEALIRAGFYSRIVNRERRALVLYDLAGEHFQEGAGEIVTEQAANSDCIYVLIDITCIPAFEESIRPEDRKAAKRKADFNAKLSASLRQIEGDETPRVVVVTKVDLVDTPHSDPESEVTDGASSFRARWEDVNAEVDAAQVSVATNGASGPLNMRRAALNNLNEIKQRAQNPSAQTREDLEELARSNLEKLKSFYDPADPKQRVIRERLGGRTIKGAFFVWTTGLASVAEEIPSSAAPSELQPPSASSQDPSLAESSQHSAASAAPAATANPPATAEGQPAVSYGVLELVKYTLELE
jgi:hypothetical protein